LIFFADVCSDFGFLFLYLVGVSLVTELVEVTKLLLLPVDT